MNEWPRAVTTASIWIAVGFSLGFGLFKMNFTGHNASVFFLPILLTGMIFHRLADIPSKPNGVSEQSSRHMQESPTPLPLPWFHRNRRR